MYELKHVVVENLNSRIVQTGTKHSLESKEKFLLEIRPTDAP